MLQSLNTWYLGQVRLHVSAKNDKPYCPNYKSTKGVHFTTISGLRSPPLQFKIHIQCKRYRMPKT